jgi:hypothetical protein
VKWWEVGCGEGVAREGNRAFGLYLMLWRSVGNAESVV